MSNKLRVLFMVSLLLNVLLVGFVLGDLSNRFRRDYFLGQQGREFVSALPEDKARWVFETFQGVHSMNRDAHKKVRRARREVIEILTAPAFDEAAYRAQVDRIHGLRGLMRGRLTDATVQMAQQLDREDRVALARHLKRGAEVPRLRKPPRHDRGPHPAESR
jgi:uncharacterized membrane protein